MYKKIIIFIAALMLIIIPISLAGNENLDINEIAEELKLDAEYTKVTGWAEMKNDSDIKELELLKMCKDAADTWGYDGSLDTFCGDIYGCRQAYIRGIDHNGNTLYITAVNQKNDDGWESHIIIEVTAVEQMDDIDDVKRRAKRLLSSLSNTNDVQLYTNYCFSLEGSMNKELLIKAIFKLSDTELVRYVDIDGMISMTGYSPRIKGYTISGGEKININAAARYTKWNERTMIWIGTPLISIEY